MKSLTENIKIIYLNKFVWKIYNFLSYWVLISIFLLWLLYIWIDLDDEDDDVFSTFKRKLLNIFNFKPFQFLLLIVIIISKALENLLRNNNSLYLLNKSYIGLVNLFYLLNLLRCK
jgi:hypothetical protein